MAKKKTDDRQEVVMSLITEPDYDLGRKLYDAADQTDGDVLRIMLHMARQQTGQEILPAMQERIRGIAVVREQGSSMEVAVFEGDEFAILNNFYALLARGFSHTVSWSWERVREILHTRSVISGVQHRPLECSSTGIGMITEQAFNVQSPLAYEIAHGSDLTEFCIALDLPPVPPMETTWDRYRNPDLEREMEHCVFEVINVWRLSLWMRYLRRKIDAEQMEELRERLRQRLLRSSHPAHRRYLESWQLS